MEQENDSVKRIVIKEFREKGYLQEVNRLFLHPLGLALEIVIHENGIESLNGIWDYRDDKEGMYYGINDPKISSLDRVETFKKKADFISSEMSNRCRNREVELGFMIEPIPRVNEQTDSSE